MKRKLFFSPSGCGTELELGWLKMVDGSHGDWQTVSVGWQQQSSLRNYIWVSSQHAGEPPQRVAGANNSERHTSSVAPPTL